MNTTRLIRMCALLLLLVACSAPGVNLTPTAPTLPLVRYASLGVFDPVYIAMDRGLFQKHGVRVELTGNNLGGPTAIQAVAAGRAEAGLSSIPALINANQAGLPVQGVADLQTEMPNSPKGVFMVQADSPYTSAASLAGHKVAINLVRSSFHYTWLMAWDAAGVSPDSVQTVVLPFGSQAQALAQGDVQAIGLMSPYAEQAEATFPGKFRRLFTGSDVFGDRQFTLIFVNRIWAADHPDAANGFIAAVKEAEAWANANSADANKIVAPQLKMDATYFPNYQFVTGGGVVTADVTFWMDVLRQRKELTVDWLKPADVATP